MEPVHSFLLVAVVCVVTVGLRFLPFILFHNGVPKPIVYLGNVLPCAMIGMLVVYCLKEVTFARAAGWLPYAFAVCVVAMLHRWKHNTLLSILAGTLSYMALLQIFPPI